MKAAALILALMLAIADTKPGGTRRDPPPPNTYENLSPYHL
jgi:hypothetical protein